MRRIKAIYLIPVFAILLIGAVFAEYYLLIVPQMEKTKTAADAWKAAKAACAAEEPKYEASLKEQVEHSERLLNNYHTFHNIQETMPKIFAMKTYYAGRDRDGLRELYRLMSTRELPNELDRWVKGYNLPYNQQFAFSGTLPFEDGLTDVKFLEANLGDQTFKARGYADLVRQVQASTGYRYFPLLIEPKDSKITIKVDTSVPYNPRTPALTMPYTAKGYAFTRGWNPGGPITAVGNDLAEAQALLANPPVPTPKRTQFGGQYPPPPLMFWHFPHKDIAP